MDQLGKLLMEGMGQLKRDVEQDFTDEFVAMHQKFKQARSEKRKREILEEMLGIPNVSFDLKAGLANEFRILKQTEFSKILGENLLAKPDELTNHNLQIIIHCIAPIRQQAAEILKSRPNLTDEDRTYLDPYYWPRLDELANSAENLKSIR